LAAGYINQYIWSSWAIYYKKSKTCCR